MIAQMPHARLVTVGINYEKKGLDMGIKNKKNLLPFCFSSATT
jgi:hypothetical protein